MKNTLLIFTIFLLTIPGIFAIDITVEKQSDNEVYIPGIDNPIIFDLRITNNGPSDSFEFYNLVGFEMSPVEKVQIDKGDTKNVKLEISPIGEIEQRGGYSFSYYIKGKDASEVKETLVFRVIDFENLFEIGSGEVNPELNNFKIYIYNRESFKFDEVTAKFKSPFFEFEETFPLGPNQKKDFTIQLNREDFKELTAGFYTLNTEITAEGQNAKIESVINFVQKDLLVTTKKSYGFIVNTEIIEKENQGNTVVESETMIKKNILSRIFTRFNPEPNTVERIGSKVYYSWQNSVQPGEILKIESRTNWTWPLLCIIFIIIIVVFAKKYSESDLVITKRISFVRAKGGEFALKVSIILRARRYADKIVLVDRLPPLVSLYEQFGKETPSRVDAKNRRIEWSFDKLDEGEIRMMNYIIYSKVGVVGKFILPQSTAIYERDGKVKEAVSNKAFYISGQRRKDLE
jgi:hypothetical protein